MRLDSVTDVSKFATTGLIRKRLGSLAAPLSASDCCQRSCPLGVFAAESLVAYGVPNGSIPTAAVLPCLMFEADLRAGPIYDFDLRKSVLGGFDFRSCGA